MPGDVFDTWSTFSSDVVAVAGTQSMLVDLASVKFLPDPPAIIYYDNILVRQKD